MKFPFRHINYCLGYCRLYNIGNYSEVFFTKFVPPFPSFYFKYVLSMICLCVSLKSISLGCISVVLNDRHTSNTQRKPLGISRIQTCTSSDDIGLVFLCFPWRVIKYSQYWSRRLRLLNMLDYQNPFRLKHCVKHLRNNEEGYH
jgi:hypothetical protein